MINNFFNNLEFLLYFFVLILPLLNAIILGFFGKKINTYKSSTITSLCHSLAFALSGCLFSSIVLDNTACYFTIHCVFINKPLGFIFDSRSVILICVILLIAIIVHIFVIENYYMLKNLYLIMVYISLVTFFSIILVTIENFIISIISFQCIIILTYFFLDFLFSFNFWA